MKLLNLALPLALLPPAAAQTQLHVVDASAGPGTDFTDIQAAVDAAADGDVLLVRAGNYGALTIDGRSLSVVGDLSAWKSYLPPITLDSITVRGLTTGQDVTLANVWSWGTHSTISGDVPADSLRVERCLGTVSIERCQLFSSAYPGLPNEQSVEVEDVAWIQLAETSVFGGAITTQPDGCPNPAGVALRATRSKVGLYSSYVQGGNGAPWVPSQSHDRGSCDMVLGGSAVEIGADTDLAAMRTFIEGGSSGHIWSLDGPAFLGSNLPSTWIQCMAQNGATNPLPVLPEDPGPGVSTLASPVQYEGQGSAVGMSGAYGALGVILAAGDLAAPWSLPGWATPVMLADPAIVASGVLGPDGTLMMPFTVPPLPPGTEAVELRVQGATVQLDSGGRPTVLLGPSRLAVLLDGSLAPGGLADCDGDGSPDLLEIACGLASDSDGDAIPDLCEILAGTLPDADGDLVPDGSDCDGNGVDDVLEILSGFAPGIFGFWIHIACDRAGY